MSKRSLLEEGTVRRFMKLAGNEVLASNILTEQPAPPEAAGPEDELAGAEADLGGLEAAEDMDMDVEEEPEAGEEVDEEVEDAVRAMVDAIAAVASDFGVDVEVSEEEPAELEPEFGPEDEELEEPEEELEGPEGGAGDPFGGDEEEPLQEGEPRPGPHIPVYEGGKSYHPNSRAAQECEADPASCNEWHVECAKNPNNPMCKAGSAEKLQESKRRRKRKRRLMQERPKPSKPVEDVYGTRSCQNKCDATHEAYDEWDCKECKKFAKEQQGRRTSLEEIDYIDEDAALNEVYHRVINRLLKEKRADKMAGVLAQRVAARLKRPRR